MKNDYALEVLAFAKLQTKKWFIAFLVMLTITFITNICWLYAWCLPSYENDNSVQVNSEEGNANYLNGNGDIENGSKR